MIKINQMLPLALLATALATGCGNNKVAEHVPEENWVAGCPYMVTAIDISQPGPGRIVNSNPTSELNKIILTDKPLVLTNVSFYKNPKQAISGSSFEITLTRILEQKVTAQATNSTVAPATSDIVQSSILMFNIKEISGSFNTTSPNMSQADADMYFKDKSSTSSIDQKSIVDFMPSPNRSITLISKSYYNPNTETWNDVTEYPHPNVPTKLIVRTKANKITSLEIQLPPQDGKVERLCVQSGSVKKSEL